MNRTFRRRVREAIKDPVLQIALDSNAERRMGEWESVFSSLPNANALRMQAHEVRRRTLADWKYYSDRFIRMAESHGIQVHHAADAEVACRLVIDLIRLHGATLVAKSKSMVSEEIGLNHALQQNGIRPVETDLGEFIVQLRNEPPAHIVTPAIHLSRQDVAATFERELGMPYSTDVEDMNAAARDTLREVFLSAQVGISGVNFGVSETGTICLVTNEGNGRMVTTLPPVHIALMGMERLLPTLDDLVVMLQLLSRSSTGQKMTSYVSLIQRPREDVDVDGPDERHLILVDNGRSRLAEGPLAESLFCIRCGACLNVCPVYQEIGGHTYQSVYPGPIGSVISPGLFGVGDYGHLAKVSTLCGACREVCPVQIDLPRMLLRVRRRYAEETSRYSVMSWVMRLFAWVMNSDRRYRLAQRLAAWTSLFLPRKEGWLKRFPPPLSRWTASRYFPRFVRRPFWSVKRRVTAELSPRKLIVMAEHGESAPSSTSVPDDLTVVFAKELQALRGTFIRCRKEQVLQKVVSFLKKKNVSTVLAWGQRETDMEKLLHGLRDAGFEVRESHWVSRDPSRRREQLLDLAGAGAGLTGATAALADTGTVVVPGGGDRSLLASLLPPIHLVVLPAEKVYRSMADWIEDGGKETIQREPIVLMISGPSCTADIEMTLTIGVHGPGELIVFCID